MSWQKFLISSALTHTMYYKLLLPNGIFVGGHCIGVDPYYLAQKAQEVGYHPEIILAGRRLNDGMGAYVADEVVKLMLRKGMQIMNSEVLILGFTFKENCPDVRNTRVIDIVKRLKEYHINVCIHDPWANAEEVVHEYNVNCTNENMYNKKFHAIILAVAHRQFFDMDINSLAHENAVLFDVKSVLPEKLKATRL